MAALRDLSALIKVEAARLQAAERDSRLRNWKQWMTQDFLDGGRGAYAWCKADKGARAVAVQRNDGSYTAEPAEAHSILLDSWLPIFRMRDFEEAPSRDTVMTTFGAHVPQP